MTTADILMYVAMYLGGGTASSGVTWLNFRDNFASYCDKYTKPIVWAIVVILTLIYPITLLIGGLMYVGRYQVAKKKALEAQNGVTQ